MRETNKSLRFNVGINCIIAWQVENQVLFIIDILTFIASR